MGEAAVILGMTRIPRAAFAADPGLAAAVNHSRASVILSFHSRVLLSFVGLAVLAQVGTTMAMLATANRTAYDLVSWNKSRRFRGPIFH